MFIARRDLWFAKGRFALMGAVVAMLALLMVLLTGLATGLVDDNISGVRNLPASYLAFNAESGVKFNQSTVERRQWEEARTRPGVQAAAPLGNSLFNAHAFTSTEAADTARQEVLARGKSTGQEGKAVDLALFGVEPGSFITPTSTEGQQLGATERGVVVSEALASKHGVKVGDTLVLDRVGTTLPVIGVPMKTSDLGGLDSLLSIVQMPTGVPVATVAIGGAKNAAILATQILGVALPKYQGVVADFKAKLAE